MADPLDVGTVVEVGVLGPLAAWRDGDPVALGGPRQRAVLARLSLADGTIVPTERLVDDLWAGDPPPSAVNTLQSYVSNLRKGFGGGAAPVIERAGPGYRLALPPDAVDSRRFERLVADALGAGSADPGRVGRDLEEALALWRGPALADFSDDEWARADAVRLAELRLTAMEARFDVLLDTGRHAGVVAELDRAVEAHPLRERFCAQLVLALYRSGRQAEALRAYERTRSHLAEELGLEPTPELVRLANAVLDHEPWLAGSRTPAQPAVVAAPPADGSGPASPAPAPAPPARVGPVQVQVPLPPAVASARTRTAFVGRAGELTALERRWSRSAAGERGIVVLAGEPGVGKTRLAMRLAEVVDRDGGYVLWGRCTAENLVAYQPVLEALRTCLGALPKSTVASILEPRPALAALLPGVAAEAGVVPSRAGSERLELYETLAELVEYVTRGNPVLLVVDDLQWADTSSLSLLQHLVCHDRDGRLLVLATLRRPAGRPTADVDRFIAELRRDDRLELLPVEGVGVDDVAALLASRGIDGAEAVAGAVHARTAGNPFFVEELAGHGDLVAGDELLPDSVRDMLDLRIGGLDPAAGRVLLAAAVIGPQADLDLLAEVCGLDTDDLLDATDAAVGQGLLVEDEEPGSVAFPHALVRQAILARATRNREAQLHLRVADALEARPERFDRLAAVAHHLLAAGRLCPPARAARAAVDAATASLDVLAPEEALVWVGRALELLDRDGLAGDATLRIDALLVRSTASRHVGDREQARAAALAAADAARAAQLPRPLARAAETAMLASAGVGFDFGILDQELVDLLADALDRQDPDDRLARADLLAWSAIVLAGRPDPVRQQALTAEAMALADELRNPALSTLTILARRIVRSGPAGLDERLALAWRGVELAERSGATVFEVSARVFGVVDLLEAGRVEESTAALEALRRRIAPFGRPGFDAYVHFLDASFALLRGDLAAAEAASNAGLAAGERAHGTNALQGWAAQQFLLAWDRGQLGDLVPLVQDMVDRFPEMPAWRAALAATQVAAGDPDAARRSYRPVLADGLAVPDDSLWSATVAMLAEVCWAVGDAQGAAIAAAALEPYAERVGLTGMGAICTGHLARPAGLALAATGRLEDALTQLGRAVDLARAAGFATWLARALVERGSLLDRRGRPGDAEAAAADRAEGEALAAGLGVALALVPGTPAPTPLVA